MGNITIAMSVVLIVCPIHSCRLINQREKRVDPQRRARGFKRLFVNGVPPLALEDVRNTQMWTRRQTHTFYLLVEFTVNVCALSAVDTESTVVNIAPFLIAFLCMQYAFPNTKLILALTILTPKPYLYCPLVLEYLPLLPIEVNWSPSNSNTEICRHTHRS